MSGAPHSQRLLKTTVAAAAAGARAAEARIRHAQAVDDLNRNARLAASGAVAATHLDDDRAEAEAAAMALARADSDRRTLEMEAAAMRAGVALDDAGGGLAQILARAALQQQGEEEQGHADHRAGDRQRQRHFDAVRAQIADYLTTAAWQRGVHQYLQILVGRAQIEGIVLEGSQSPLVQ